MVATLANILDLGAKETRQRILRDRQYGLRPYEETLTQNFVSDYLARVHRAKLRAIAGEFTKRQEARLYGADLALWYVNSAGRFAGIYLQAKVLQRDDSYSGMDHRNRRATQHQTLVDAARRDGVLAGYAFYNGLTEAQPARSSCGHGVRAPDINGISIASAHAMSHHLQWRVDRSDIEASCSPLSCLVRHAGGVSGTGAHGGGGGGTGDGAGPPDTDLPAALLGLARSWEQLDARLMDLNEVPDYVKLLAQRLNLEPDELPDERDEDYVVRYWWYLNGGPARARWSDLKPSFTAVLVGPGSDDSVQ